MQPQNMTEDLLERSFKTLMDARLAICTKTTALQNIADRISTQTNIDDICVNMTRLDEAYEKNILAADRYASFSGNKSTYARLPRETAQDISIILLHTAQELSARYPFCETIEQVLEKHQHIQEAVLVMV